MFPSLPLGPKALWSMRLPSLEPSTCADPSAKRLRLTRQALVSTKDVPPLPVKVNPSSTTCCAPISLITPPTVTLPRFAALTTIGAASVPLAVIVGKVYPPSASTRQSPAMGPHSAPPTAPGHSTWTVRLQGGRVSDGGVAGGGGMSEPSGGGGGGPSVLPPEPAPPPVPPEPATPP